MCENKLKLNKRMLQWHTVNAVQNNVHSSLPCACLCSQVPAWIILPHWLKLLIDWSAAMGGFASHESPAAATWACVMVYASKQAMYVTGGRAGDVHVCDGKKWVYMWRAYVCVSMKSMRVCCVGGLIMESCERRTPVWEKEEEEEEEERDTCRKNGWGGCRFIFSSHYLIHIFLHMSWGKGVSVCLVSTCMHETISLIHGISPSCIRWRILSWWILCISELSDLFRDQWRLTALTVHHTQSTGLVLYLEPTLIWAAEDYHPLMKNWWKLLTCLTYCFYYPL